jgi:DNA repair exonuclease SbcCD ATPase subunit
MASQDDLATLQKTFDILYTSLKDAYWAASTAEGKDQIQGARELVSEVLDAIDEAQIQSDNAMMGNLTQALKTSIKDLADLQKQLDQIVHNVAIANSAIDAIDKVLKIGATVTTVL